MSNWKIICCILSCALTQVLSAANYTWTGAANDGNKWSTKGNWKTSVVPTKNDKAIFNVTSATTIDIDTETATAKQIEISAASKAVTFGGSGKLTLTTAMSSAMNDMTTSSMPILNRNSTGYWTTFTCRLHFSGTKVPFGPGCLYSNDVSTVCSDMAFCGIQGVTPGANFKKSVFAAGFSSTYSATSGKVWFGLSAKHELVIDNGPSGKSFVSPHQTVAFSVNNAAAATSGKVTVKSGTVSFAAGTLQHATTGSSSLSVEGGTFRVGFVTSDVRGHVQVADGAEFIWGKDMMSGGSAQLPDFIWDDETIFVARNYRLLPTGSASIYANYYLDGALQMDASDAVLNLDTKYTGSLVLDGRGTGSITVPYVDVYGSPSRLQNLTLSIGSQFKSQYQGGTLCFRNDTIRLYGDLTDYTVCEQKFYFEGTNVIDTLDCKDGVTAHTAVFKTSCFEDPTGSLTVKGGGTVTFDNMYAAQLTGEFLWQTLAAEGSGTVAEFIHSSGIEAEVLTIGSGATVTVDAGLVRAGRLVLASDATLQLAFSTGKTGSLIAENVEQQGMSTLAVTIPAGTEDAAYRLTAGAAFDASKTTVAITDNTGRAYEAHFLDGDIWLSPSNPGTVTQYEWTGKVSGQWSVAENWTHLPVEGAAIYVRGFDNRAMDNDLGTMFGSVTFRKTAGPFTLSGNALVLTNAVPVLNESQFEQILNCDVAFSGKTVTLQSDADATGGLTFNGAVRTTDGGGDSDHLYINGLVRFAGEVFLHKLMFSSDASTLRVLPGGRVSVTNQPDVAAQTLGYGQLVVDEGGVFTWADTNGKAFCWSREHTHTLNGQMVIGAKYGASDGCVQAYTGTGRLDIAGGFNYLKNQTLPVAGGIALNVGGDFPTAEADGSDSCAAIALTNSTLGALADWTYGPASAVTDATSLLTTPARRALKISGACVIDTQDPDSGEAHTVTFTDPIDASEGTLTKTGAGNLVLAPDTDSLRNNLSNGLVLKGGRVYFSAPYAAGVAGKIVFSGGAFAVTPLFGRTCRTWTTVVTATAIEGDVPADPKGRFDYRVVSTASGYAIQVRSKSAGFVVVFGPRDDE